MNVWIWTALAVVTIALGAVPILMAMHRAPEIEPPAEPEPRCPDCSWSLSGGELTSVRYVLDHPCVEHCGCGSQIWHEAARRYRGLDN